ncbi:hypothetical protein K9L05_04500 [Candidatus Babeliales bacterium]|nr:hypothetical protein [Candidatus Babeliales bacterium]MCF7899872.1 hypothetical protein [Candidatus Babeliales bacterium]
MSNNLKKLKKILLFSILLFLCSKKIFSIDNAHFYKTPNLYSRPTDCKFDGKKHYSIQDWYTKIDVNYEYGDSKKCSDWTSESSTLLNRAGNQKMAYLDSGLSDVTTITPELLPYKYFLRDARNYIAQNPRKTICELAFDGKFEINELNLDLRQNIISGLFVQLLVPVRHVNLKQIKYIDKTDTTADFFDATRTNTWESLKENLSPILNSYGIQNYNQTIKKTNFGDITLLLGWQGYPCSNDNPKIDIGLELKMGLMFPAGSNLNPNSIFSIPTGYDGHWGVTFQGQANLEYQNWLYLAAHASSTFFMTDRKTKLLKTDELQQGSIKLARGRVKSDAGLLWHIGIDAKLDHIFKGFSALVGYSYNRQEAEKVSQVGDYFDQNIIDTDKNFYQWSMNTAHFMIDYDFSVHMPNSKFAPRINIFYNLPFSTRNSFKTNMIGGGLGADIRWSF